MIEFPKLGLEFNINRVLFSIGGFEVYWYGLLVTLGLFLGLVFALISAKKHGLIKDDVFDVGFWGAVIGIVGARAYYVIFNAGDYNIRTAILGIRDGGLAIYGGIIFGTIGAAIIAKVKRVNFPAFTDLAAFGFLIGQAIGRWGNFFNREVYGVGTNSPFAMRGDGISIYDENIYDNILPAFDGVHPLFFYESMWCVFGFIGLILYRRNRTFDGELFLLYCSWYGLGRFIFEGLRPAEYVLFIGENIRISQVVAAFAFVAGIVLFVLNKRKNNTLYVSTAESIERLKNFPLDSRVRDEQKKATAALNKEMKRLKDAADYEKII